MLLSTRISLNYASFTRCLSSTAEKTRIKTYLDAWVGTPSSAATKVAETTKTLKDDSKQSQTPLQTKKNNPLLLSGSSYLMPTLRMERKDTVDSIATRIQSALSTDTPGAAVKSMLRGKPFKNKKSGGQWHVPIVLDLSALVPDGSPHYVSPPNGYLKDLCHTLDTFGIRVVGVTSNVPSILEDQAVNQLGLASFMSKSRVVDRQSVTSFAMSDVVKLVCTKSQVNDCDETALEGKESNAHVSVFEEFSETEMSDATVRTDTAIRTKEAEVEVISSSDVENDPSRSEESIDDASSFPEVTGGTKVFHGSVRSGQQVSSGKNESLIVIGGVNSGGEVLSDGDIVVFGKLRGRALAGLGTARTKQSAKICATSFDPELVCIGDTFTTVDDVVAELGLHQPGEPAMVSLNDNGELVFERIML